MGDNKKRSHFKEENNYLSQKTKKALVLKSGLRGFFCTCNFQGKNCIREAYNLLNEYADKLLGSEDSGGKNAADDPNDSFDSFDLFDSMPALKSGKPKLFRFKSVDISAPNCLFIRTSIEDPVKLGNAIVQDIATTKTRRTKFLLRLVPIEATCGVELNDIIDTAGKLFDKYFLSEPTTFYIVFNRRFNNSLSRDAVIKQLADLVVSKNVEHKTNLTNPKLSVIVEIVKEICLLSVVPDYFQLKKYNLIELCAPPPAEKKPPTLQ